MPKQVMKKRLLKDIVIPAGTIFDEAPVRIEYHEYSYAQTIGLTKDSHGDFIYCFDPNDPEIGEWFEDVKGTG